jgi:hypothetical protein
MRCGAMMSEMVTVVEIRNFERQAEQCMSQEERNEFIAFISHNPEAGDVIQGTGGIRKVRWAVGSKGKSGGVRVIYYFHSLDIPLFLLDVYAKSSQADLSAAEKKLLRKLAQEIVDTYHDK